MAVTTHALQVDGDGNAAFFLESRHIDDRHRVLVVRYHVAARVGDINLALDNLEFVGLEAHEAGVHNLHGYGIDFGDIAALLIVGVNLHRARITRDIGIAAKEADEAAVGDVDLVLLAAGVLVEHINLVGAVDDAIQVAAVDADVVTHVAHLLGHGGVGRGEDVADIFTVAVVVIVERGLIPAHIALAQEIEALDIGKFRLSDRHVLGQEDGDLLAARRQQEQREQYVEYPFHQMSNLRMSL